MNNKYGQRLKELREKRGYSQEELARLLGTSRSRIGMYEQGRRQPDFEMQEAIADLFNVSIDYLFKRRDDDPELIQEATRLGQKILDLPPDKQDALRKYLQFLISDS